MTKLVKKALDKLQHNPRTKPQYAPHDVNKPTLSPKPQLAHEETSLLLSFTDINKIQSIARDFLYYDQAMNSTILPAVNEIVITQSKPIEQTIVK